MNSQGMKITDHYPKEPFDRKQQMEWARTVVDRLRSYASAAAQSPAQASGSRHK
ncbi:MAG: hypothetical protein ACI3VN_06535 [Candidatus Onthomonas sp.]